MVVVAYPVNKKIHTLRIKFGCSQEMLGHIIGVSGKTIARWEGDKNNPSFLAIQKVKELQTILDKMDGVIKKEMEKEWLNTPNESLGNKTPLEVIGQGSSGIQEVLRLLGRLEWGIPT